MQENLWKKKYGSGIGQRPFLNAQYASTDVLQYIKQLEGDYATNGSFSVVGKLAVTGQFKMQNTNPTTRGDAEFTTVNGHIKLNASRDVQVSNGTNLFLPNALHFTEKSLFEVTSSPTLSLHARREGGDAGGAASAALPNLLISDSSLSFVPGTTTNDTMTTLVSSVSTTTSRKSSLAIETNNTVSQLHCLYTGTDFKGKSVLADALGGPRARVSAQVTASNSASLLFEDHDSETLTPQPLAALRFTVDAKVPSKLLTDTWGDIQLPSSATKRHWVAEIQEGLNETGLYSFPSAPIFASFDAKRTTVSCPYTYPSITARNRLAVTTVATSASSSTATPDPSLLLGCMEPETSVDLVRAFLSPLAASINSTNDGNSVAGLHLRAGTTNQVELTRYDDHHRLTGDMVTVPAAWTASATGRQLVAGRTSRAPEVPVTLPTSTINLTNSTAITSTSAKVVFQSCGKSTFRRPGARLHFRHRVTPDESEHVSMTPFVRPASSEAQGEFTRTWFFGRQLAVYLEKPKLFEEQQQQAVIKYRHPVHVRVSNSPAAGRFTWFSKTNLFDDILEIYSMASTPLSVVCLMPYYSSRGGSLFVDMDLDPLVTHRDPSTQCALIVGHLYGIQALYLIPRVDLLSDAASAKRISTGGGDDDNTSGSGSYLTRTDVQVTSMNFLASPTPCFRVVSFAKYGVTGWIGVQVFEFSTGSVVATARLSNLNLSPNIMLVPNRHRVTTFPARGVPILAPNAVDDRFVATHYTSSAQELTIRYLRIAYTYVSEQQSPWIVDVVKEAEVSSVSVPDKLLQNLLMFTSGDVAGNAALAMELYSTPAPPNQTNEYYNGGTAPMGTTSTVRAAGAITYSFLEAGEEKHQFVLCVNSQWLVNVDFRQRGSPIVHTQMIDLGLSSSLTPTPTGVIFSRLRRVVLQPVKTWVDVRGRTSVLFLNLAALVFDTRPDFDESRSTHPDLALAAPTLLLERVEQVLDGLIPVFYRWDVDDEGNTIEASSRPLYLTSEVDVDGEWTRLLTLQKTALRRAAETNNYLVGEYFTGKVLSSVGAIFPNSDDLQRDKQEMQACKQQPWLHPAGELCIEVIGAGHLSLDLAPFCPWFEKRSKDSAAIPTAALLEMEAATETSSTALEIEQGDLRLKNDARLIGDGIGPMVVAPSNTDHSLHLGTLADVKIHSGTGNRIVEVAPESTLQVSHVRGHHVEGSGLTEEVLVVGGSPTLPMNLQMCLNDTGSVTLGATSVTRDLKALRTFRAAHIRGLTPDEAHDRDPTKPWTLQEMLTISGDADSTLQLNLCTNPGDVLIMGQMVSGSSTSETVSAYNVTIRDRMTSLRADGSAVIEGDFSCSGNTIQLGEVAESTTVFVNARTAVFTTDRPEEYGLQVLDGAVVQW